MKPKQMATSNPLIAVSILLLISLSCALFGPSLPKVINHPAPDISINTQPFEEAGCPSENGFQRCSPNSPLGKLGCQQIRPPGDYLGGLEPDYPIIICLTQAKPTDTKPPKEDYVYAEGCLLKQYLNYVIWEDDKFELVKSPSEFKSVYAPIETEVEALSYALAVTGYSAHYGLEAQRSFRYFVDRIEDTRVTPLQDGFLVHLFDYRLCGCGPHPTYSVEIHVKNSGDWQETNRVRIYEDPEQDDLCVD